LQVDDVMIIHNHTESRDAHTSNQPANCILMRTFRQYSKYHPALIKHYTELNSGAVNSFACMGEYIASFSPDGRDPSDALLVDMQAVSAVSQVPQFLHASASLVIDASEMSTLWTGGPDFVLPCHQSLPTSKRRPNHECAIENFTGEQEQDLRCSIALLLERRELLRRRLQAKKLNFQPWCIRKVKQTTSMPEQVAPTFTPASHAVVTALASAAGWHGRQDAPQEEALRPTECPITASCTCSPSPVRDSVLSNKHYSAERCGSESQLTLAKSSSITESRESIGVPDHRGRAQAVHDEEHRSLREGRRTLRHARDFEHRQMREHDKEVDRLGRLLRRAAELDVTRCCNDVRTLLSARSQCEEAGMLPGLPPCASGETEVQQLHMKFSSSCGPSRLHTLLSGAKLAKQLFVGSLLLDDRILKVVEQSFLFTSEEVRVLSPSANELCAALNGTEIAAFGEFAQEEMLECHSDDVLGTFAQMLVKLLLPGLLRLLGLERALLERDMLTCAVPIDEWTWPCLAQLALLIFVQRELNCSEVRILEEIRDSESFGSLMGGSDTCKTAIRDQTHRDGCLRYCCRDRREDCVQITRITTPGHSVNSMLAASSLSSGLLEDVMILHGCCRPLVCERCVLSEPESGLNDPCKLNIFCERDSYVLSPLRIESRRSSLPHSWRCRYLETSYSNEQDLPSKMCHDVLLQLIGLPESQILSTKARMWEHALRDRVVGASTFETLEEALCKGQYSTVSSFVTDVRQLLTLAQVRSAQDSAALFHVESLLAKFEVLLRVQLPSSKSTSICGQCRTCIPNMSLSVSRCSHCDTLFHARCIHVDATDLYLDPHAVWCPLCGCLVSHRKQFNGSFGYTLSAARKCAAFQTVGWVDSVNACFRYDQHIHGHYVLRSQYGVITHMLLPNVDEQFNISADASPAAPSAVERLYLEDCVAAAARSHSTLYFDCLLSACSLNDGAPKTRSEWVATLASVVSILSSLPEAQQFLAYIAFGSELAHSDGNRLNKIVSSAVARVRKKSLRHVNGCSATGSDLSCTQLDNITPRAHLVPGSPQKRKTIICEVFDLALLHLLPMTRCFGPSDQSNEQMYQCSSTEQMAPLGSVGITHMQPLSSHDSRKLKEASLTAQVIAAASKHVEKHKQLAVLMDELEHSREHSLACANPKLNAETYTTPGKSIPPDLTTVETHCTLCGGDFDYLNSSFVIFNPGAGSHDSHAQRSLISSSEVDVLSTPDCAAAHDFCAETSVHTKVAFTSKGRLRPSRFDLQPVSLTRFWRIAASSSGDLGRTVSRLVCEPASFVIQCATEIRGEPNSCTYSIQQSVAAAARLLFCLRCGTQWPAVNMELHSNLTATFPDAAGICDAPGGHSALTQQDIYVALEHQLAQKTRQLDCEYTKIMLSGMELTQHANFSIAYVRRSRLLWLASVHARKQSRQGVQTFQMNFLNWSAAFVRCVDVDDVLSETVVCTVVKSRLYSLYNSSTTSRQRASALDLVLDPFVHPHDPFCLWLHPGQPHSPDSLVHRKAKPPTWEMASALSRIETAVPMGSKRERWSSQAVTCSGLTLSPDPYTLIVYVLMLESDMDPDCIRDHWCQIRPLLPGRDYLYRLPSYSWAFFLVRFLDNALV